MSTSYRAIIRRLSGAQRIRSGTPRRRKPAAGPSRQKQAAMLMPLLAATILTATMEPRFADATLDRSGARIFVQEAPSSAGTPEERAAPHRPPGLFQVY